MRRSSRGLVLLFVGLLSGRVLGGPPPRLLFDLDRGLSDPLVATSFAGGSDGRVYFIGCDEAHGCELWRTDGTEEGTELVRDTIPGPCYTGGWFEACRPDDAWARTTQVAGRVLLAEGRWQTFSQGDMGQTFLIGPLARVESNGETLPLDGVALDPRERLVEMGGAAYFRGMKPIPERLNERPDYGLYRTDGTAAGTRRVASGSIWGLVAGPDHVYYLAPMASGDEVFWSDGTETGTGPLVRGYRATPIGALTAPDGHEVLYVLDSSFSLAAVDAIPGQERRPRTVAVRGFTAASPGVVVDGILYFPAWSSGWRLWRTDGTDTGTWAVFPPAGVPPSPIRGLIRSRDGVAFSALDEHGIEAVYRIASTAAEPARLTPESGTPRTIRGLTTVGDHLWFSLAPHDELLDAEAGIWTSDGTAGGTRLAVSARRGASSNATPEVFMGGRLLLSTRGRRATVNEPSKSFLGSSIYAADGSRVPRLVHRTQGWGRLRFFSEGTPTLALFLEVACPGASPPSAEACASELWATDGTADRVRLLERQWGGGYAGTTESAAVAGRLVHAGLRGHLYATDSSLWAERLSEGTVLRIGRAGDRAIALISTASEYCLLTTDGTSRGTRTIATLASADPPELIHPGGDVFLVATSKDLWRTDGTGAGTYPIAPLFPVSGATPTEDGFLVTTAQRWGESLPFSWYPKADHDLHLVLDRPYRKDSPPSFVREDSGTLVGSVHGRALFVRDLAANRFQLLASRGAEVATIELGTFERAEPRLPNVWDPVGVQAPVTVVGTTAYFVAGTPSTGLELWRTDGTPEGTRPVADIAKGPASSFPRDLTLWNGQLVFSADEGSHGRELWVYPPHPVRVALP